MKEIPKKRYIVPIAIVCAALAFIYAAGAWYFSLHFFPHTFVFGTSIGYMTAAEGTEVIGRLCSIGSIAIKGRTGEDELALREACAARSCPSADEILEKQDIRRWPFLVAETFSFGDSYEVLYNTDGLLRDIESYLSSKAIGAESPHNAFIDYDSETCLYEIVPETAGTKINPARFRRAVAAALSADIDSVDLEKEGVYYLASIKSDDRELHDRLNYVNLVNASSLSVDMGAGTVLPLKGLDIMAFLDDEGRVDREYVAEYAAFIAQVFDTYDTSEKRKIVTHSGEEKYIYAYYGWELNEEKTAERLEEALEKIVEQADGKSPAAGEEGTMDAVAQSASGADETGAEETTDKVPGEIKAVWRHEAASHDDPDYGDTYVEVDMGEQNVYVYVGGELVIDTPCVTGLMRDDRDTPEGLYTIKYKQTNKILTGYKPDGSIDYQSFVNYWMPFNGGIGLHDATWRSSFGGNIYLTNGSHGCINLQKSAASELFGICYTGMPVICYY